MIPKNYNNGQHAEIFFRYPLDAIIASVSWEQLAAFSLYLTPIKQEEFTPSTRNVVTCLGLMKS